MYVRGITEGCVKVKKEAIGLEYVKNPPKGFEGKSNCGIKVGLNFYFTTQEEADFVYEIFKDGVSRIPSGKKLLEFIKEHTGREPKTRSVRQKAL